MQILFGWEISLETMPYSTDILNNISYIYLPALVCCPVVRIVFSYVRINSI